MQRSGGHSVFFRHMNRFTCQHVVGISVGLGTRLVYGNFYGRFFGKIDACANRPFLLPLLKGPGDEATCCLCLDSRCSAVSWPCTCLLLLSLSLQPRFSCFCSSSSLVSSCTLSLCGVTSVPLNPGSCSYSLSLEP